MAITERLILPVTGGVDAWKEPLKFMLQTLKKQDGYIRTRWGPHSEDESKLELLIGWESTDAQKTFQASPAFESSMSQLKTVLSGKPTVYFMQLVPYAPKAVIDASIVQMVTVSPANISVEEFRSQIEQYKTIPGCTGVASGEALSEVDGKGKPFVGAIGWETLEASQKGGHAVNIKAGDLEEHHVNFRYPIKGFGGL
ncbi:uncharacterized protein LY89DRAFT_682848 [Mollisia scopiformis]|uniref:ABM domain-containing protein n=1 Tax=Mollisia scopiformis TaxID=149040 RepID=A0A194XJT7_MOLSC|nr:uncharacterized protein LY89DRAFT_682848 [Mollisia scopiformis]KUJ20047.1 hypothetical protein LY89DRAFT_682848 [Mollisia scopiformis]